MTQGSVPSRGGGGEMTSPTPTSRRSGEISPPTTSQFDARLESSQISTDLNSGVSGRNNFRASGNSSRFVTYHAAGGPISVSHRASRSSLQYQVSCEDNSGLDDSLVTALEDQDDILLLCEYSPLPYDHPAHGMNYKGKTNNNIVPLIIITIVY